MTGLPRKSERLTCWSGVEFRRKSGATVPSGIAVFIVFASIVSVIGQISNRGNRPTHVKRSLAALLPTCPRISQQLVERDRHGPDALPRRVVDGVGDGSRNADDANLTDALRTYWVHMIVTLF